VQTSEGAVGDDGGLRRERVTDQAEGPGGETKIPRKSRNTPLKDLTQVVTKGIRGSLKYKVSKNRPAKRRGGRNSAKRRTEEKKRQLHFSTGFGFIERLTAWSFTLI